jgi:lysine 2,3-aminomutase
VTPYYLSVIDHEDPESPLRRSVILRTEEMIRGPDDSVDPLSEHEDLLEGEELRFPLYLAPKT